MRMKKYRDKIRSRNYREFWPLNSVWIVANYETWGQTAHKSVKVVTLYGVHTQFSDETETKEV